MSDYLLGDRCSTLDRVSVVQVGTKVHPSSVQCYCKLFVEVKSTLRKNIIQLPTASRSSIRVSSPFSPSHGVVQKYRINNGFSSQVFCGCFSTSLTVCSFPSTLSWCYQSWHSHTEVLRKLLIFLLRSKVTFVWNKNDTYYFAKWLLLSSNLETDPSITKFTHGD